MINYKTIIFDLDGTISDPKVGLVNSIIYSCKKFGITEYDINEFSSFIGPPLHISYQKRFNLSNDDANLIVKYYREYYEEKGKFENKLYNGITELLHKLYISNKTLAIATSKPTHFTKQILSHFSIDKYFKVIVGSNLDNTMSDKSEIIAEVLSQLNPSSLEETIMIGDRYFDIIGAHSNNIKCISVLYGYGSRTEFEKYSTDYILENVEQLNDFLIHI